LSERERVREGEIGTENNALHSGEHAQHPNKETSRLTSGFP
jgi:hypothetical protein